MIRVHRYKFCSVGFTLFHPNGANLQYTAYRGTRYDHLVPLFHPSPHIFDRTVSNQLQLLLCPRVALLNLSIINIGKCRFIHRIQQFCISHLTAIFSPCTASFIPRGVVPVRRTASNKTILNPINLRNAFLYHKTLFGQKALI